VHRQDTDNRLSPGSVEDADHGAVTAFQFECGGGGVVHRRDDIDVQECRRTISLQPQTVAELDPLPPHAQALSAGPRPHRALRSQARSEHLL